MNEYRVTSMRRFVNRAMVSLARRGMAPGGITSLTVVGRSSGIERTIPVSPIVFDGAEYLVAPYGVVDWVRNLRAAGVATIGRGKSVERIEAIETDAATAAPILQAYVRREPIVRPFVAAGPDDPVSTFEAIAHQHPVFLIRPARG